MNEEHKGVWLKVWDGKWSTTTTWGGEQGNGTLKYEYWNEWTLEVKWSEVMWCDGKKNYWMNRSTV